MSEQLISRQQKENLGEKIFEIFERKSLPDPPLLTEKVCKVLKVMKSKANNFAKFDIINQVLDISEAREDGNIDEDL